MSVLQPCQVERGDRRVRGVKCVCGRCRRHATSHLPNFKSASDQHEEAWAIKQFEKLGWAVGARERDHLCPACIGEQHQQQKVVAMTHVVRAEPPREMTRTDRRIIHLKLEDCYADEKSGYRSGWTDARVAKELNVPRAWVEKIRDESFGPLGENPEIREAVEEGRAFVAAAKSEAAKIVAEADRIEKRLINLRDSLQ